jgi:diguanylate cyclase (GGDEF)-like protein
MRGFWLLLAGVVLACLILAGLGLRGALAWARRRDMQRELRVQAEQDSLTGLLNRRAMQREAARALGLARRAGESVAVLLLDLDHFKAINDGYGHAVGDRVLRDLADCVTRSVRAGDLVCRWGGEEVLVLLRDCNGPTVLARGETLRGAIEALYADGAGPVPRITASLGAAVYPHDGADLEALVGAADTMLYAAKGAGRNRVLLAPLPEAAPARLAA